MGIFGAIVQPLVGAMFDSRHDRAPGGGVGAEFVGYEPLWRTFLFTQKPCQQSPRSLCIAVDLHDFVEHVSLLINGAPEIALLPIDGDDDLVEMPDVCGGLAPFASGAGHSRGRI